MKRLVWILICLPIALAACTSAGDGILPLDRMAGGFDGPEVVDVTGTSAVVRFTSGVPTVCNVAYGLSTGYGSLATMAMMGGAVRDHAVALPGLTPGSTVHYRITLTDEQARVYRSQDLTFETGPEADEEGADRPEGENLALLSAGARVIGVSSNFGRGTDDGTWGANSAIDGDASTAWSSAGDGDDAWIEIELAREADVTTIGFWTRTMPNGTAQIFAFTVTTDRGETYGPFDLPDASGAHVFAVSFTARTLRFDAVETNTGNTGAVEIEVYGTAAE